MQEQLCELFKPPDNCMACQSCGRPNPVWFLQVVRPSDLLAGALTTSGLVCIPFPSMHTIADVSRTWHMLDLQVNRLGQHNVRERDSLRPFSTMMLNHSAGLFLNCSTRSSQSCTFNTDETLSCHHLLVTRRIVRNHSARRTCLGESEIIFLAFLAQQCIAMYFTKVATQVIGGSASESVALARKSTNAALPKGPSESLSLSISQGFPWKQSTTLSCLDSGCHGQHLKAAHQLY